MTAPAENVNLIEVLRLAVPLHIYEIRNWSVYNRIHEAQNCVDEVASKGDILQFGSKKKGETARAFNRLARGLALLAYQPGGVDFAGEHWCTDHGVCLGDAKPNESFGRPVQTVIASGDVL